MNTTRRAPRGSLRSRRLDVAASGVAALIDRVVPISGPENHPVAVGSPYRVDGVFPEEGGGRTAVDWNVIHARLAVVDDGDGNRPAVGRPPWRPAQLDAAD
jgi:hypothetical protein